MKNIFTTFKKAITAAAFSVFSLVLASSSFANGEGGMELNGLKISGYLDVSGVWNFNKPSTGVNAFRAFDVNSNSFEINTAQVVLEKQNEGGALFKLKLLLGRKGSIVNFPAGSAGTVAPVEEAYLSLPVSDKLSLVAGKFVTLEGVEVIESTANYNFSHGLLFTWAEAFTHTGLRLDYQANEATLLKLAIVNGWDVVKDNNDAKTLMAQINWTMSPKASFVFTDMYGAEEPGLNGPKRNSLDIVGNFNLMEDLTAALQLNIGDEQASAFTGGKRVKWNGWGLWLKKTVNDNLNISGRYEMFNDKDGFKTCVSVAFPAAGTGCTSQKLQNFTLTAEMPKCVVNDVTMRLEYRADSSDFAGAFDSNGNASKSQNTLSANWVYKF